MNINLDLKDKVIEDDSLRWVEIYKITNKINQKVYIGQAISHKKSYNKYYPKGMIGRFKEHIKEIKPKQKYHCNALNNAIKTYGVENFILELICYTDIENANIIETNEIKKHNSLIPNGYNINTSCNTLLPSSELREKISNGNIQSHLKRHLSKFDNYIFNVDESEFDNYITPRTKNNKQIGWYVKVNKITIEFVSSISSIDEVKERAYNFLKLLKERNSNLATHSNCGKSLIA